jgi:hypothetical protein
MGFPPTLVELIAIALACAISVYPVRHFGLISASLITTIASVILMSLYPSLSSDGFFSFFAFFELVLTVSLGRLIMFFLIVVLILAIARQFFFRNHSRNIFTR